MFCLENCLKRKFSNFPCMCVKCETILFVLSLHSFACMSATGYLMCQYASIYIIANIVGTFLLSSISSSVREVLAKVQVGEVFTDFNVKFPCLLVLRILNHYMYSCATQIKTNSDIVLIIKWRNHSMIVRYLPSSNV